MEIERKFLTDGFPALPVLSEATMLQGYLCCAPVVRIRSRKTAEKTDYKLCFKGKGTLVREEIELPIDADTFQRLCALLPGALIQKQWKSYRLDNGLVLECSLVDGDTPQAFYYAEVEFSSQQQASEFVPPVFLGKEVTEDPSYSMNSYWLRTRLQTGE